MILSAIRGPPRLAPTHVPTVRRAMAGIPALAAARKRRKDAYSRQEGRSRSTARGPPPRGRPAYRKDVAACPSPPRHPRPPPGCLPPNCLPRCGRRAWRTGSESRWMTPPAAATMGTPLSGCQATLMAEARRPGSLVMMGDNPALPAMPERPTLKDFYQLRLSKTGTNHMLQSAKVARENGLDEKVIMACL